MHESHRTYENKGSKQQETVKACGRNKGMGDEESGRAKSKEQYMYMCIHGSLRVATTAPPNSPANRSYSDNLSLHHPLFTSD